MIKRYKTEASATAHETALGLTETGVMSKQAMEALDTTCLDPVEEMTREQIRLLRLREYPSQAVFVRYIDVTMSLACQWEREETRPRGPSLKSLTLVAKHGLGAVA